MGSADEDQKVSQGIGELSAEIERLTQQLQGLRRLRAQALEGLTAMESAGAKLAADLEQAERRHQDEARRSESEVDELTTKLETAGVENARLASELADIDRHRQQLIAALNAIGASESWRLGHALTWPVRVVRRTRKGEISSQPQP